MSPDVDLLMERFNEILLFPLFHFLILLSCFFIFSSLAEELLGLTERQHTGETQKGEREHMATFACVLFFSFSNIFCEAWHSLAWRRCSKNGNRGPNQNSDTKINFSNTQPKSEFICIDLLSRGVLWSFFRWLHCQRASLLSFKGSLLLSR